MTRNTESEFCEGCDRRRETTLCEMEYGGYELLCDECLRESAGIIVATGEDAK